METNFDHRQTNTYDVSKGQYVQDWFDIRGEGLGKLAFVLNRITGIGLVVYLALHLVLLGQLAFGEQSWDTFVAIAKSPVFLALDVVLIAGILIHGLNGIRIALVGAGYGVRYQKMLFVVTMIVAILVLVYAGFRVFTT